MRPHGPTIAPTFATAWRKNTRDPPVTTQIVPATTSRQGAHFSYAAVVLLHRGHHLLKWRVDTANCSICKGISEQKSNQANKSPKCFVDKKDQKGMQTKANTMLGTFDTCYRVYQKEETKKSPFIDTIKIRHSTAADNGWPPPHVCTEVIPLKAAAIEAPSAPLNKGPGLRKSSRLREGRPTQTNAARYARCNKMQQDATRCNKMQQDAARCSKVQQGAAKCRCCKNNKSRQSRQHGIGVGRLQSS